MEAAKKEGLVLSYKILAGASANPDDWDILLLAEYENFAAFDDMDDKFEILIEKIMGD